MMELKINPEYEALLPKLSAEKYSSLKNSIKEEGLWHPITVNSQGIILDGHNRFHICVELGIGSRCLRGEPYEVRDFADPLLEKRFVIESNLDRRNLNEFQMCELGLPLLAIEEELAKRRQLEGQEKGREARYENVGISSFELKPKAKELQARDVVARKVGVSATTFERFRAVIELGSEALKAQCRLNLVSISGAYGQVRGRRQVEAAKKAAAALSVEDGSESDAKIPETADELDEASKRLSAEAKKKRDAAKTSEQKVEEARLKLVANARKSFNATVKKVDKAEKIFDVSVFRSRLKELEESLEQNPSGVKKQLILLGKEVVVAEKQRQKEIEAEKKRKEVEEAKRKAEEDLKQKADEQRKRLEDEAKKEADVEARQKLLDDEKFRREAAKKQKKIDAKKQDEKRKKQLEKIAKLPPPEGKYQVVVIDPPWAYENRVDDISHRARSPYPQMSVDEIIAKLPPCTDDCVVWLWTTNAFMHDAFHVLDAWSLEAKTILTWKKNKIGLGDWLRGQTEHCILAIKGKPVVTLTNQSTFIEGDMREHSRKPDSFFKLVEGLCHGSKLEMYGREEREGWIVSGLLGFK